MSSLFNENLISDFVAESRDHLEMIEPDLLRMELDRDSLPSEIVARIFRCIHSIKGGAGFLSFEKLKHLSHAMESVLMLIRDGELVVTPECIDSLLHSVDTLRMMLEDIQSSENVPCEQDIDSLNRIIEKKGSATSKAAEKPLPPLQETKNRTVNLFETYREKIEKAVKRAKYVYNLTVYYQWDLHQAGISVSEFITDIKSMGEILESTVDLDVLINESESRDEKEFFQLLFATPLEKELMLIAVKLPESQVVLYEKGRQNESEPESYLNPPIKLTTSSPTPIQDPQPLSAKQMQKNSSAPTDRDANETLRVRIDLLNRLINTAGELVLGRNQLMRTIEGYRDIDSNLSAILQKIDHITTVLQEEILQTRMQPIGTVFGRYPRLVRDMSHQLGKEIEIQIEGSEVELDKSIIELLSDPLIHLVRNCADHAIETPTEREKKGKRRCGLILLKAFHEGGQVNIIIRDDGRGIDSRVIAQKALEKGIIRPSELEKLTESEIINLICLPGFSTADKITDVSGRGVGMDVVKVNIEKLGGHLQIESKIDVGTTVLLRLPLTLAIMPCLIVGTGGYRFAIPQVKIVELVWIYAEELESKIEYIRNSPVLRLRSKLLPLVRFAEVLDYSASSRHDFCILVLREGSDLYGLIVDELYDMEEVVVKPTSSYVKQCRFFAGACILGDGRVAMILDVGGLTKFVNLHFTEIQSEEKRRMAEISQLDAQRNKTKRSVILFTINPDEYFAVPQEQVLRLEQIQSSAIQTVGRKEFLPYQDQTLQLYRLDRVLPIRPLPTDLAELYLIIPKRVDSKNGTVSVQTGFLVSHVLDTLDVYDHLHESGITGPGIVGSSVLDGRLIHFLDPNEILEIFQSAGD